MLRPGARAWIATALGIAVYEFFAPDEELMSEAADRWIERQPIIARVTILTIGFLITAHVSNSIPRPEVLDVMSQHFWTRILT